MDFPKKQQQSLIPRYLLQYLQDLQISHNDPTAPWGGGGGGGSYTAGDGIDITNDVISVDNTVAKKSEIPTNYVTTDTVQVITGQKQINTAFNFGDGDHNNIMVTADYVNRPLIAMYNDTTGVEFSIGVDNDTETPVNGAYFSHTDDNGERYYALPHQDATGLNTYTLATTSDIPTKTSDLTNDSRFITSSALTGYATETWVTNQGYSTFSGSYNDLTNKPDLSIYETKSEAFSGDYNDLINKPTIPVVPTNISAFTNDSGYITSSALSNYVTTNTTQTISGSKKFTNTVTFSGSNNNTGMFVFTGRNPIKMTAPSSSTTGFTLFNSNNNEKGYLQYNSTQDGLYLGRWGNLSSPKYAQNIGFLSELDSYGYRVLMPNKTVTSGAATSTANTYYIATEITNGTTIVKATSEGILNISSLLPTVPTNTSDLTNDSGFITSSALTGYATETWVTNQGYSTFSGSYNDLTNKPDLSVYAKLNDDTQNITASTITVTPGSGYIHTTYGPSTISMSIPRTPGYTLTIPTKDGILATTSDIPTNTSDLTNDSGYITSSALTGYVTTNTSQDITGTKTFVGRQTLKFRQANTSDVVGFTVYNTSQNEIGNLQVADRTVGGNTHTYVTLGNYSGYPTKSKLGFRVQPNSSSDSYNFVMPYGTNNQFTNNGYSTTADTTIPCAFTDGATKIKADATGVVDLSSLNLGGSSYTAGTGIDITNDVISIDSSVVALKSDIPTVPTKTSDLTNDAGYITNSVNNLTNYFDKTQIQNMFADTTAVIPVANVDPADFPTAQTQSLTNLYVESNDTIYTVSGGGGGTGPTVTKYNTSSYMDYGYNGARTYKIYDGLLNSDEFRIENTNPGDILLFDITIKYKTQNMSFSPYLSNRYLIKITVPVKSTNTSYESPSYANGHYDVSKSYEMITNNHNTWSYNFMTLTIENITSASTTNRIVIGELNVPDYIGTSGANGEIIINSITHIAF